MTIVTTSRKPVPEIRSLAKDLAFAIGCTYVLRGKMGLSELNSKYPVFFLLSLEQGNFRMKLIDDDSVIADYRVDVQEVTTRSAVRMEGLFVSNQSVYEELKPYIPVKLTEEPSGALMFDGTRKKRYVLNLTAYGA